MEVPTTAVDSDTSTASCTVRHNGFGTSFHSSAKSVPVVKTRQNT